MASWFITIVSLCIAALLRSIFTTLWKKNQLPPGPPSILVIGNLIWLRKSISELEFILRSLKTYYGPIITMRIGSGAFIFITSHSLAHRALIQNGAIFSDTCDQGTQPDPEGNQRLPVRSNLASPPPESHTRDPPSLSHQVSFELPLLDPSITRQSNSRNRGA